MLKTKTDRDFLRCCLEMHVLTKLECGRVAKLSVFEIKK